MIRVLVSAAALLFISQHAATEQPLKRSLLRGLYEIAAMVRPNQE